MRSEHGKTAYSTYQTSYSTERQTRQPLRLLFAHYGSVINAAAWRVFPSPTQPLKLVLHEPTLLLSTNQWANFDGYVAQNVNLCLQQSDPRGDFR